MSTTLMIRTALLPTTLHPTIVGGGVALVLLLAVLLAAHLGLFAAVVAGLRSHLGASPAPTSTAARTAVHGGGLVALVARAVRSALRHGARLGPVELLTVPGRVTGLPRETPVDLWRDGDRAYVVATHTADAGWVRNLRVAGTARVGHGRRSWDAAASELGEQESLDVLLRIVRPRLARPFGGLVLRRTMHLGRSATETELRELVAGHPVFLLMPTLAALATEPARPPLPRAVARGLALAGTAAAAVHAGLGMAHVLPLGAVLTGVCLGGAVALAGHHLFVLPASPAR